jgi:2-hydroxy-6-oxonona-2,4-dienedioate hydrolase
MAYELQSENGFDFIDVGTGHPLVLLHGLMGGLSNFDDTIKHFSDRGYRVLVPQLPLYTLPIISTNVKNISKYIKEFLAHKNLTGVTLIGNSLGGHVGLVFTKRNPEAVHSLVLTGSSGLYESAMGDSFPRRGDYEYIKKKTEEVFYDPKVANKELVDEVFSIVNSREKVIRTVAISKSAIRHNMAEELKNFHMPVCLIWGANDKVTPPEVANKFHELLPQSELYWIDQCGHAAMMEKPAEFNAILEEWLSRHVQQPA